MLKVLENAEVAQTNASRKARLSIFGLGYVGAVSAACFAHEGHKVIGVDPDARKVESVGNGRAPIVEPNLNEYLAGGVADGFLSTTTDPISAIHDTDVSFVCVGTPSAEDGSCDTTYLRMVSQQIGEALATKDGYHVIVYRSTVPPSTTRKELMPIIEAASGKTCGKDFGIGFHPEFLRESTAIADFYEPPKTVIGGIDERSTDTIADMYDGIDDEVIRTTIEAAEMVKYVDNTWHALKVSFANEIGKVCQATDVDSHEVMDIFVRDTKLNISSYYMRPGFAFGGSCLPKDVRGMNKLAQRYGLETPVIGSIIRSNQAQIAHAVDLVRQTESDTIGFLGITFKEDTDDLRESPILPVIAALMQEGKRVLIHDNNLDLEASVRHHLMHAKADDSGTALVMSRLSEMLCGSPEDVRREADTIVVSHRNPMYQQVATERRHGQHVVDLVRLFDRSGAWDQMRDCGMDDYLQKPIQRERLNAIIDAWLPARAEGPRRVLVVDDDPAMSMVAMSMLGKHGCTVTHANNGAEALAVVETSKIDLILMDVSMPVMDGFDATRLIRAQGNTTPVIAMTAYAMPEDSATYTGICW